MPGLFSNAVVNMNLNLFPLSNICSWSMINFEGVLCHGRHDCVHARKVQEMLLGDFDADGGTLDSIREIVL